MSCTQKNKERQEAVVALADKRKQNRQLLGRVVLAMLVVPLLLLLSLFLFSHLPHLPLL